MRRFHVVANWKANFTWREAAAWMGVVGPKLNLIDRVTVCPSFPFVRPLAAEIKKHGYPIRVGTQTISPLPMGAHTGEVPAAQVADVVELSLIGHHERQVDQHETLEEMREELAQCRRAEISALVFFQQVSELSKLGKLERGWAACVYEPAGAISTHDPSPKFIQQTIDQLDILIASLRRMFASDPPPLYYGGSMTAALLPRVLENKDIEGAVVGAASLVPDAFMEIVRGCR